MEHRLLGRVRKRVPGASSFPSLPMELFNQPNLAEHFSSATEMHLQPTNFHSLTEIGLTPSFLKLYNSGGEARKWVFQRYLNEEREVNLHGKLDGVKISSAM